MKTRIKYKLLFSFLFLSNLSFAQSTGDANVLLYALITVGLFLLLWAIMSLSDNLLKIEAEKNGIDPESNDIGIVPKISGLFGPSIPSYVNGKIHHFKKGFDIKLAGKATKELDQDIVSSRFSLQPQNFEGISPIPKVEVEVGDEVVAGDVIFYDKKRPEIKYVAPVSGEIVDVVRGAKRSITDIIILADKDIKYKSIQVPNIDECTRQDIVDTMLESGMWTMLNQRPFDLVPDIEDIPANIFISTFNTAPLAANCNMLVAGKEAAFQKGLDVLSKLTVGNVHLGLDGKNKPADVFINATGVVKSYYAGKHPAGNVGIQIHHTAPIRNEKVWTAGVEEVASIGALFLNGKIDLSRKVALTGAELDDPGYVNTYLGANLGDLIKDNAKGDNLRVISGDVLTGKQSSMEGFLNYRDNQVTVIKEGDNYEMFGWLLPLRPRPSISKTMPGFLMPNFEYTADTNTHGEKRAFVVTGQYESVLPMDIYPQHLMKAILTNDIERMEGLGISELSEEDIALCEFVCTSKQPLQSILRTGLNMMREQL